DQSASPSSRPVNGSPENPCQGRTGVYSATTCTPISPAPWDQNIVHQARKREGTRVHCERERKGPGRTHRPLRGRGRRRGGGGPVGSAYCAASRCCIMTRGRPSGGAHMAVVDPFVPLRDWRTSLYRGDPAVVDRFLDAIDATLTPDWVRDREYE